MRLGSLCTGIGGLDLAVEAFFGAETVWCAEWEDAPSSVIARHWPGLPNYRDLTTLDWAALEPVDILTAGYPCQPFSHAGKRKGQDDDRHLWPYVAEAVRVLRPRWVVLENVAGHLTLGFGDVLRDLAEAGFDAEWCLLRASDVGACHQRARLFIAAADASGAGAGREPQAVPGAPDGPRRPGEHVHAPRDAGSAAGDAAVEGLAGPTEGGVQRREPVALRGPASDAPDLGHERGRGTRGGRPGPADSGVIPADPDGGGLEVSPQLDSDPGQDATDGGSRGGHLDGLDHVARWGRYAAAIARHERLVGRPAPSPKDDQDRLAPPFVEWMMGYPEGWVDGLSRTAALKALGNAVVPQQAYAALCELVPVDSDRRELAFAGADPGASANFAEAGDG